MAGLARRQWEKGITTQQVLQCSHTAAAACSALVDLCNITHECFNNQPVAHGQLGAAHALCLKRARPLSNLIRHQHRVNAAGGDQRMPAGRRSQDTVRMGALCRLVERQWCLIPAGATAEPAASRPASLMAFCLLCPAQHAAPACHPLITGLLFPAAHTPVGGDAVDGRRPLHTLICHKLAQPALACTTEQRGRRSNQAWAHRHRPLRQPQAGQASPQLANRLLQACMWTLRLPSVQHSAARHSAARHIKRTCAVPAPADR